jgi:hypothetical protein
MLLCGVALALVWLASPTMAADVGKGNILFEYFTNIGAGTAITDLTSNPKFPNSPDISEWATSFLSRVDWVDSAGTHARGYVYPPQTGDYTFWVAGDDACQLFLSTDDTPANATMIAQVTGWTPAMDWNNTGGGAGGPEQKSKAITLQAGQRYFIEALEKEGGGGDSVAAAWAGPGIGTAPVLIDGKYLAPFIRTPEPLLKAQNPNPADGAVNVVMALMTWTKGAATASENVYFGTDPANLPAVSSNQLMPVYFSMTPLTPGVTYYWRVDEVEADGTTIQGTVWKFMGTPTKDYQPTPADGASGQAFGVTLSWKAGLDAVQHEVYFGSDQAAVTSGAASVDQGKVSALTFSTGGLRASTTYFWRVDVVKADKSVVAGDVWTFTTADAGPANKIENQYWLNIGAGSAITDLTTNARYPDSPDATTFLDSWLFPPGSSGGSNWNDNYGDREFGWLKPAVTGDYTFWVAGDDLCELWLSTDGSPANAKLIAQVTGWTNAMDWDNTTGGSTDVTKLKSAPQHLVAGQKYYILTLHKEIGGGDSVGVAWQGGDIATRTLLLAQYVDTYYLPPLQAFAPSPADGATTVPQSLTLGWSAGDKAVTHDVYLGTDKAAVAAADTKSPLYQGSQSTPSFSAAGLTWNTTYYWRVDEVNPGDSASPWKGPVWSFTTANFLPVDDMESYNDDNNRIYDTWIDGLGDGKSNSQVGYDAAPFAEQTIVHGGKQSLPLKYDNSTAPFFSEAVQTFSSTEDWTVNDVNALSLWVRGYPAITAVTVNVANNALSLTGDGTDIWNNSDDFVYAYKTLTGDGTIVARVVSIGAGTNTWAKGGVMIRDSLNGGSTFVNQVMTANSDGTAGNGSSFQYRLAADGACGNTDSGTVLKPPYWVKLQRAGDAVSGYVSVNGTAWTQMGTTQTITMTAPVYIGICVTSHQAGEQRTVQFDNIATTGNVTGAWQGAQINSPGYNDVASMYVTVEDSSGKSATATNATAVNAATWTDWKIALKSLTGVNLAKVKKLYIGVGDKKNPAAGGAGRIFIDDIQVTKP